MSTMRTNIFKLEILSIKVTVPITFKSKRVRLSHIAQEVLNPLVYMVNKITHKQVLFRNQEARVDHDPYLPTFIDLKKLMEHLNKSLLRMI